MTRVTMTTTTIIKQQLMNCMGTSDEEGSGREGFSQPPAAGAHDVVPLHDGVVPNNLEYLMKKKWLKYQGRLTVPKIDVNTTSEENPHQGKHHLSHKSTYSRNKWQETSRIN